MKKSIAVSVICVLAAVAVLFSALYFTNNANKTKQIDSLTADIAEKASENKKLEEDAADRAEQIRTLENDVADKTGQIEKLEADIADKAEQIKTLEDDVADKAGQIEKLKEDIAFKAGQIETLKADVDDKAEQIKKLNDDITEKDKQIGGLNDDINKKDEEINRLNGEIKENEKQIGGLKDDVAEKDKEINRLNGEIKNKDEQIGKKDEEINRLNGEIKEKDKQIGDLKDDIGEKDEEINRLNGEIENKEKQIGKKDEEINRLNGEIDKRDKQIGELKDEIKSKDEQISNLMSDSDNNRNTPDQDAGEEAIPIFPQETPAPDSGIVTESVKKPFTVACKITPKKRILGMVLGTVMKNDKKQLAGVNALIDLIGKLDWKTVSDGTDSMSTVSLNGTDLTSLLVLKGEDKLTLISDLLPSYSFSLSAGDAAGKADLEKMDPQKLLAAVSQPVMKAVAGIRFGTAEQVKEKLAGAVFTVRTPVDMTTKELGLLILNAAREIAANEDTAALVQGLQFLNIDASPEAIDKAIDALSNSDESTMSITDAALYTNEKGDSLVRVRFLQDVNEIVVQAGTVNGFTVCDVRSGDKLHLNVKAGTSEADLSLKTEQGLQLGLHAEAEKRENGGAVLGSLSLYGMNIVEFEAVRIDEGELTGIDNTLDRTEVTLQDFREKQNEILNAVRDDFRNKGLPALMQRLREVDPDAAEVISSTWIGQ